MPFNNVRLLVLMLTFPSRRFPKPRLDLRYSFGNGTYFPERMKGVRFLPFKVGSTPLRMVTGQSGVWRALRNWHCLSCPGLSIRTHLSISSRPRRQTLFSAYSCLFLRPSTKHFRHRRSLFLLSNPDLEGTLVELNSTSLQLVPGKAQKPLKGEQHLQPIRMT